MDDSADDILGERFAVLTVALEDATTLAIEGQGRELSAATVESLAVKIDQKLESSRQILTDINNILNRAT